MLTKFVLECESDIDDYLNDLLNKKEYRSESEVIRRAQNLINDENLRNYFISRGKEILNAE